MKRHILVSVIFFLLLPLALAKTDNWLITKSTHFIVYYKNAPQDFIERLIERAEDYYDKIADDLGFRRYNFWLWDNRAKIYIYDDAKDYQIATGQPTWSSGCTVIREKIIHTFPYAKGFFETTLPHEMGHIIFREFVGFDNDNIPLWLDEGVASYQENFIRRRAYRLIRDAIDKNKFINLERLSNLNPKLIQDTESVNLFYAEAISIIDYLIKEFSKDKFVLFCQALRDKENLEKAIISVYPFESIQDLDRTWQEYLSEDISYGTK